MFEVADLLLSNAFLKLDMYFSSYMIGLPWNSAGKESACSAERPQFNSGVRKFPWRRDRLPTPAFLGFSGGSHGKESAHNAGDLDLIPGLGSSPRGGHGNPLQYSCLENPLGERRLVGYSSGGCKESNTIEQLSTAQPFMITIFISDFTSNFLCIL